MNGISDVQALLQGRPLEERRNVAERKTAAATTAAASLPADGRWALYRHRWNTRRALLELTDDELRDIGLDSGQARLEAAKPFWRD